MTFLIKDEKLLEEFESICDKVNNLMNKGFDKDTVHRKMRTKLSEYKKNPFVIKPQQTLMTANEREKHPK